MPTILLLSTADTELLAARASGADYRVANPVRVGSGAIPALARGTGLIVLRLLGGRQAWPDGVDALRAAGLPLVMLGGESAPDAELMALSTVPAGVAAEALGYLREGGPGNLRELAAFLSDTVLLTGEGFGPPQPMPQYGVHQPANSAADHQHPTAVHDHGGFEGSQHPQSSVIMEQWPAEAGDQPAGADGQPAGAPDRPTVAVIFYRAHELSGNTGFVDSLCSAIESHGATPLPVFCGSLRSPEPGLISLLGQADTVITTVLAAGGSTAASAQDGDWDAGPLAALDVPIIQGLCLTTSRSQWAESTAALTPMDAAMQVAIPEFDGRLITVPFSFKEEGPDGIGVYQADEERAARLAGIAARHARLRHTPNSAKRIVIALSSYPTKHARVGNAVGLDTPASAVRLLRSMREVGYDLGGGFPEDGDELIHALIAAGGHDTEWLTEEQLARAEVRIPPVTYRRWFIRICNEAARRALHRRRPHRAGRAAIRQRGDDDPAAAGVRREPGGDLPRPRAAAVAPLPGRLPMAGRGVRR